MSEGGRKLFCPFCGAKDEMLTYLEYHDPLIRRDVYNIHCNSCGQHYLLIEIPEESDEYLRSWQEMEKLIEKVRLKLDEKVKKIVRGES